MYARIRTRTQGSTCALVDPYSCLACCADGGRRELYALEDRRLDAADQSLDGGVDRDWLRLARNKSLDHERVSTLADLDAQLTKHRQHYQVKTHDGKLLRFVMYYDAVVLVLILAIGVIYLPWTNGYFLASDDAIWWATLYFFRFLYALLAFPFLMFILPVVGEKLHGAHRTAYDVWGAGSNLTGRHTRTHTYTCTDSRRPMLACGPRAAQMSGMLCPAMSSALLRAKMKAETDDPSERMAERLRVVTEVGAQVKKVWDQGRDKAASTIQKQVLTGKQTNKVVKLAEKMTGFDLDGDGSVGHQKTVDELRAAVGRGGATASTSTAPAPVGSSVEA